MLCVGKPRAKVKRLVVRAREDKTDYLGARSPLVVESDGRWAGTPVMPPPTVEADIYSLPELLALLTGSFQQPNYLNKFWMF